MTVFSLDCNIICNIKVTPGSINQIQYYSKTASTQILPPCKECDQRKSWSESLRTQHFGNDSFDGKRGILKQLMSEFSTPFRTLLFSTDSSGRFPSEIIETGRPSSRRYFSSELFATFTFVTSWSSSLFLVINVFPRKGTTRVLETERLEG